MEDIIMKAFTESKLQLDLADIIKIIIVIILTVAVFIALTVVKKRIKSNPEIKGDLRKMHTYTVAFRIAKIITAAAGSVAILQSIGVNLAGLTAFFGVIIVIFVLAVKDALQDLFAGFVIMADKYFLVGDAVEYGGRDGIVIGFTTRSTKIEFLDDRSVLSVANRKITEIRKLTHLVDVDLTLPYGLGRKTAFSVIEGICGDIRAIEGIERCELKGAQDFGANGMKYKIRFFCEPNDRPDIRREVIKTVMDGLENANIQIPYQQIDVHS